MNTKIMKAFLVLLLLGTSLSACTQKDPIEEEPIDEEPIDEEPVVVALDQKYQGEIGNTGGNLFNWGLIVDKGEWLYLSEALNFNRIIKMKADGSERTLLTNTQNNFQLNVVGDWIIYLESSSVWSESGVIMKMKTDGTSTTALTDFIVSKLFVKGNYIYYLKDSDSKIYRTQLDGKDTVLLVDDEVYGMGLSGEWVVYTDRTLGKLRKIRLDGKVGTILGEDPCGGRYFTDDLATYCASNGGIGVTITKTDGSGTNTLEVMTGIFTFNLVDNHFYYGADGGLYMSDLNGESLTQISTTKFTNSLNSGGNWLYYENQYPWYDVNRVSLDGKTKESLMSLVMVDPTSIAPKPSDTLAHDSSWLLLLDGWAYQNMYAGYLTKIKGDKVESVYPYETSEYIKVGDWIYILEWATVYTKTLSRIKIDGTELVFFDTPNIGDMKIKDDWIYYTSKDSLYRMKTNGSQNTMLTTDRVSSFDIHQESIYYVATTGENGDEEGNGSTIVFADIHKTNLDGASNQIIVSGPVWNIDLEGDALYFSKTENGKTSIYRTDLDGSNLSLLIAEAFYIRLVHLDWVYWTKVVDRHCVIVRTKTDGSVSEEIATLNNDNTQFELIDEKIYYIDYIDQVIGIHKMDLDGKNQSLFLK
jgi:predicted small lipoprotein YifL